MDAPILNPAALCVRFLSVSILQSCPDCRRKSKNTVHPYHLTILIVCRRRRGVSATVLD